MTLWVLAFTVLCSNQAPDSSEFYFRSFDEAAETYYAVNAGDWDAECIRRDPVLKEIQGEEVSE